MTRLDWIGGAAVVTLAMALTTCGGGSSNSSVTAPGGSSGSGPACRTYATNSNVTTVSRGVTLNAVQTGTFDTAAKQAIVKEFFVNGTLCSTGVASYNSVADFVDEIRTIPGVTLATGSTTTNSGSCGSGTASGTN